MKVSPVIEESFMYMGAGQRDPDWLPDTASMESRNIYWSRLKRAWAECPQNFDSSIVSGDRIAQWFETEWGFKIHRISTNGMITGEYTVVDEKKYLMYLLKFG